jgi:hypothetical protein
MKPGTRPTTPAREKTIVPPSPIVATMVTYGAYMQDKVEYDSSNLLAWHNKVGNATAYVDNATVDYHHCPTTITSTTLVRY